MPSAPVQSYRYGHLPMDTSFRVLELLPGKEDDTVSVVLHTDDLATPRPYEALSYTWGNVESKASFICDGKRIEATTNLHAALCHLRFETESRFLWVDALCIDQLNIPERGHQVKHMRSIYHKADSVHIWLGRDSRKYQGKAAIEAIRTISDFLCDKLGLELGDLRSVKDPLYDIITKKRELLPVPNECPFSKDIPWEALAWFYSHKYFTRVWIIQEVNVSASRILHCGYETIEWERVDLVAGYIIMETAFSQKFGFTDAYCWWAASLAEISYSKSWLFMLYLASNFSCGDSRDYIYGLRGLMRFNKSPDLLLPDYSKTLTEVYRDCVEAAFTDFENTDVLYYLSGTEDPSWVPTWHTPKLFRNPFRLTSGVPWKPAGETTPIWSVDRGESILTLSGLDFGTLDYAESYNESIFGTLAIASAESREQSCQLWSRILKMLKSKFPAPFNPQVLTAAAVSFSFGLDEKKMIAENARLLQNFVAYLQLVFQERISALEEYIPADTLEESRNADGNAFGKPVWDFEYPESSIFITEGGLLGCAISSTQPGDTLFAALGSAYPHVLRPEGEGIVRIRGYAYVHGIMEGEKKGLDVTTVKIR